MIISKPQTSTLISFVLFLTITIIVVSMNVFVLIKDPSPAWYNYLIIGLLIPIFIVVLYRIFIRYKVVQFGDNRIEVRYPVLKKKLTYHLPQEVDFWVENTVKTGKNSFYREIGILFSDKKKITLGEKEFTNYDKVARYLNQKITRKKKEPAQ